MKQRWMAFLLAAVCCLSGCSVPQKETEPTRETQPQYNHVVPNGAPGTPVHLDFESTDTQMLSVQEYILPPGTRNYAVKCSGTTATADTDTVRCQNGTVTITGQAVYEISGSLTGMLVVDAGKEDTVHLILKGLQVNCPTGAALYIRKAARVIVTLADGTENVLSNGGSFQPVDESAIDGAVFSKKDLLLTGNGSLQVESPAGHGIVCKDNLLINGGSITITAAGHGLDANDSIRIGKASLTINAGKDGIHGEKADDPTLGFVYLSGGTVTVTAAGDGISAGAWLQVESGHYSLNCGGGYENGKEHSDGFGGPGGPPPGGHRAAQTEEDSVSSKGLKAAAGLVVNGGTITIDAADDGLHSDSVLVVNGGSISIATGDDAIHAEETLTVTNCDLNVTVSYEGLEAHEVYITGGKLRLVTKDDGINAAGGNDESGYGGQDQRPGGFGGHGGNSTGVVTISGGDLYIQASGDGIDANGSLTITGGYTVVCGPTQGDTAVLDYDNKATINGGTFIGTGSVMMAQTLTSNAEQGVVAVYSQRGFAAGSALSLKDANGKVLVDYTPELPFQLVILTTPEMKVGTEYTLTVGETSAPVQAN